MTCYHGLKRSLAAARLNMCAALIQGHFGALTKN